MNASIRYRVGQHKRDRAGTSWSKLMAYEVVPGVEMTLEEIAHVAGVSKARIGQIYDVALRKLCRDAARRLMAEYR